ncbi:alkanesulfonate monooxygenase SsuD/methylene tetrahydromethanopterin reductase-like flavin-dependent oxidoreductase (luciferase family) [Microbacterium halimionae]|uniref:Alkanesulfonate monooxygenase SsuD/methylene tetrahydromethanopterin reductase-like flavin-dependent oxidoreductase (Luciferase family) n=1 Tax=Microbacterium halimionae TaxID=1526413 RepID=A0A7W3JN10_9MICO|nr:LLM class flavin-dependent oxidoreductase [Microbacterium halimionae]MBA8815749.1 alkanesulfonate monooxygenase SsuD/methylene tetrahydromethanopterin reductase-like flavin-dependent oxidoreductase (luciferase family) [Microbacterium halimionae]NII95795.1 alkanesulfonate monooxygenase SsuD/methylene tetrahydromethanopterin reductase-like flavin-dependent oxidoreductase (luciferase family) [Microbacterium halimionae]
MNDRRGHVSIGVAAAIGTVRIRAIAALVEQAGFHALWINDTPGADALAGLAAAAAVTERINLATGVVPLDRRSADQIVDEVSSLELPEDRLIVGIGTGGMRTGALAHMRAAVDTVKDGTHARVVVGALGPKMRALAAERSDGVLLNWLTPEAAAEQTDETRSRGNARSILYVRTAFDPAAAAALEEESDRYASFPQYAANFARLGVSAVDTVIAPGEHAGERLSAYRGAVDEVVLRAITPRNTARDDAAFVARAAIERDS